ncbi:RELT-like protein 1 [Polyodon spathula]|uniref:RELT-like protein 1 n=1 Tax=Polyodon spathula TaxID=7913 RepID=UPI001B7DA87C|nr:RELT-like protein 1 [Polyodon spathula]
MTSGGQDDVPKRHKEDQTYAYFPTIQRVQSRRKNNPLLLYSWLQQQVLHCLVGTSYVIVLTAVNGTGVPVGDGNSGSLAFVLVPIFFIMGLLGVLLCHILKKKGYRCTTNAEADIEEEKIEEEPEMNDTFSECNADTVGQIVHYIMKNEANSEALTAMLQDNNIDPDSPTSPNSPGIQSIPASPDTPLTLKPGSTPSKHTCQGNHLHTVGGVAERNVCSRCNHKKWPLMRQGSKSRELKRIRQGEVTVLSVGRFRVTKTENKSNPKQRKSLISQDEKSGSNREVPATPTQEESKSRTVSESQEQSSTDL